MRRSNLALATSSLLALAVAGPAFAQSGTSAETGQANAPDQTPAFQNQTRAPLPAEATPVSVETVAKDLPHLWSLEFLPDGRMLVTAKQGALHIIEKDGTAGPAITGVPKVVARGQGGLLDVALSPGFAENRTIFLSFSEPREGGNGTSVARARLNEAGDALEDVSVIFRQMPSYDGNKHFGSRLAFDPAGNLFVTVGERSDRPIRDRAQDLAAGMGKVFRIDPETGKAAKDNPFAGKGSAQPEIWSYGHRNLQSAAIDAEGRLWTVEHGAKGGDELNRPEAGLNYGWPVITYGEDYSGKPIGQGITAKDGMEQPVYYWDPVIGPSGMAFYRGEEFPQWQGAALIGGLVSKGLIILKLDANGHVASEERVPLEARIRDVKLRPDGAVYAVTESRGGSSTILRLTRGDKA
ncbi:PQQ-dependent sugar dehydrogenase [Mangrovicella endophytica]|uniref:PQQ-dependent sugar dehydrogenase n=1 Tax=Mangrovicella endophytica TaxID=2066697 RepID=UPI000C9E063A|nr:PQQ-dependent sugar dehydrogenase [Mangrovicella endophytica]